MAGAPWDWPMMADAIALQEIRAEIRDDLVKKAGQMWPLVMMAFR